MKRALPITTLFLDIGGVLLTDGWNHHARRRAATTFKLDLAAMEERHHLLFETYEEGKLTLEDYLNLVVFHEKRSFSRAQFRRFMFEQSKPHSDMIALIRGRICEGLTFLGIELDEARNGENAGVISAKTGRARVRVIRTDEELMLARSVLRSCGAEIAARKREYRQ